MQRLFTSLFIIVLFTAFRSEYQEYPTVKNTVFYQGEELTYRVNFGIFTIGHAITRVDKNLYAMNSRMCYKIDAFGNTGGVISWLSKVDDNWGAYVDTAALITHKSYRKIREGHFRKDEIVTFDHVHNKAEVKLMNKKTGVYDEFKTYDVKPNIRDIVAGFMYLRTIDFNKVKKKDTLVVSGFFEDTSYNLKIIYDGIEKVNTPIGKMMCHRIVPIVPDNKLFDGENSVTCWLSADENKVPVKIQAKMFIGSTGLELVSFRSLRNQLKIIQD